MSEVLPTVKALDVDHALPALLQHHLLRVIFHAALDLLLQDAPGCPLFNAALDLPRCPRSSTLPRNANV